MQVKFVFHILSMVIFGTAITAIPPLLADAVSGQHEWVVFAVPAAAMGFFGGACLLALHPGRILDP